MLNALIATASPSRSTELFGEILPWALAILVFALIGAVVIACARRMLRDDQSSDADGFSLHGLRQLHAAGKLTDEEFEKAKASLIGTLKGKDDDTQSESTATENPGSPGNSGDPDRSEQD